MSDQEIRARIQALAQAEDRRLAEGLAPTIGAGFRDLQSRRKTPRLVAARRTLVWLLRHEYHLTHARIARALDWPVIRVKRHATRTF